MIKKTLLLIFIVLASSSSTINANLFNVFSAFQTALWSGISAFSMYKHSELLKNGRDYYYCKEAKNFNSKIEKIVLKNQKPLLVATAIASGVMAFYWAIITFKNIFDENTLKAKVRGLARKLLVNTRIKV